MTIPSNTADLATAPFETIAPIDLVCYVGPPEKRAEALARLDHALRENRPADRTVASWLPTSLAEETRDALYSVTVHDEGQVLRVEVLFTGRSGDELQFSLTPTNEFVQASMASSEAPPEPVTEPTREDRVREIRRRCEQSRGTLGPSVFAAGREWTP